MLGAVHVRRARRRQWDGAPLVDSPLMPLQGWIMRRDEWRFGGAVTLALKWVGRSSPLQQHLPFASSSQRSPPPLQRAVSLRKSTTAVKVLFCKLFNNERMRANLAPLPHPSKFEICAGCCSRATPDYRHIPFQLIKRNSASEKNSVFFYNFLNKWATSLWFAYG